MPSYTKGGHKPVVIKQNRPQIRGKYLGLPTKTFLARYKRFKLRGLVNKLSKAELMDNIERSARTQATQDRHARKRKRIKTKPWLEVKHRPRGPSTHFTPQSTVPQIVVTTPDGDTRWLENPNNYECVDLGKTSLETHELT